MEKSQELLLLRAQMREERILDFLMGKSKVTEAPDPEPEDAGTDAESGDEEE
jgi:trigger factor